MKLFITSILFTFFFSINYKDMAQSSNDTSNNLITFGYRIGATFKVTANTLTLNPKFDGVGETAWVFESPSNELVILNFCWGARPNAIPVLSETYKIFHGRLTSSIDVNAEYKYNISKKDTGEEWTQLTGYLDKKMEIDIQLKPPYWTDVASTEFISLLHKHNMTMKHAE